MTLCINCNQEVSTPFCSHCGQPNPPKKITFANMWFDFQSRIYGFDGMLPRTLRDLSMRPGVVAREYIYGNRVKYYGPVGYFFLMITVFLLLLSIFEIDFIEFSKTSISGMIDVPANQSGQEIQRKLTMIMSDHMRTLSFMVIIPVTLMARLVFRKAGLNILEHAVLPFYVIGHTFWLTILTLFSFAFFATSPAFMAQLVISIFFFAFACSNFYKHNSKVKAFIKGIAVYIMGYLLFSLIIVILTVLYMFIDPEFKDLLKSGK